MNKSTYVALLIVVAFGIILWIFLSKERETPEVSPEPATVSIQSVTDVTLPGSAVLSGAKTISWQTTNYPADAGVSINLIRKVSDSPKEFDLVRKIETDTPNDGEQPWVPGTDEKGNDLYVEVTCSNSYQFKAGCSLVSDPIKAN